MDCPVCKTAMITIEYNAIEIDICPDCNGIWLDTGELEQLLEDSVAAGQLIRSFRPSGSIQEQERPCPICDKKMEKITVGRRTPPLILDRCRRQHGLWFDRNELLQVVEEVQEAGNASLAEWLKALFDHPV